MKQHSAFIAALAFSCAVSAADAQGPAPAADVEELQEIVVFGRGESKIGEATAASEGTVAGADLLVRPMVRVAELLEAVPGLIAAQHSGSGKANQYFLRGFNLDHGTDFTTYFDDVPMNLRTHGHGQGYLDVNGLIPEIVDRIDYRKGTYRADAGDFSPAGSAFMSTVSSITKPFAAIEGGQYGWRRLAGGGATALGAGRLSFIAQLKGYDGPWQQPEELKHQSAWAKYSASSGLGKTEVSVSGYHATWLPTEQVPERVIGTPVCANPFCALDPTAEGETLRWIATARILNDDWRATLYGQYYDWHMSSNPTYDYQINQFDRRWIAGGRYERTWRFAERGQVSFGVEGRYDDIGNVGVEHTERGRFVDNISRHAVQEGSVSAYSEATWKPRQGLRLSAGLRADAFDMKVRALEAGLDAGNESAARLSPKLGAAYVVSDRVELYADWGRGFHSNDARGVTKALTPAPALSPSEGREVGARFEVGSFKFTTTYWWLDLDSELKFVGDSNSVEPGAATVRRGYELVAFWRPRDWLAVDGVWTGSHARYLDQPGAEFVAGGVEHAGEFGVAAVKPRWEASMRVRYLGAYPLIEDNSERADPEIQVGLRAAYKPGKWQIYGELTNVLDNKGKDIVYYYGTNVAGIDAPPNPLDLDATRVDGRVSRAGEPRTLRIGAKYEF